VDVSSQFFTNIAEFCEFMLAEGFPLRGHEYLTLATGKFLMLTAGRGREGMKELIRRAGGLLTITRSGFGDAFIAGYSGAVLFQPFGTKRMYIQYRYGYRFAINDNVDPGRATIFQGDPDPDAFARFLICDSLFPVWIAAPTFLIYDFRCCCGDRLHGPLSSTIRPDSNDHCMVFGSSRTNGNVMEYSPPEVYSEYLCSMIEDYICFDAGELVLEYCFPIFYAFPVLNQYSEGCFCCLGRNEFPTPFSPVFEVYADMSVSL